MAYPSIADYNAAFSDPASSILIPGYARGTVRMGPFGAPLPVSGGFALIYELRLPDGARTAIRCFIDDDPVRRTAAAAAVSRLAALSERGADAAAYFVRSAWHDPFLRAGGRAVPALVMDWAEGETLGVYLEAHHAEAAALSRLQDRLRRLGADLRAAGIGHGDLQTGNIIVAENGALRLVDYDGVRFAGDAGPSLEGGHPNFQHPDRGPELDPLAADRFSAIALDLGLSALIAEPSLFDRFSTGENVLFAAEDYADPAASPAFASLAAIPALSRTASLFSELCVGPAEAVPTLEDFLALSASRGRTASSGAAARPSPAVRVYIGAYETLSALDFPATRNRVGRRVEVVGRVAGVHRGLTKYGKPYAFINFSDWRQDGFKAIFWSEGLENLRAQPSNSWTGRWISVTGLMDEPYENERFGTKQTSITVQEGNQLRFIEAEEAKRRLGSDVRASTSSTASARTSRPTNAEILASLRPVEPPQPPARPSVQRTPSPAPTQPTSTNGVNWGCLLLIALGLLAYFILSSR